MTQLTTDTSSWRVLAVDDRFDNLKLITVVLQSANITVMPTDDPERSLGLVDEFQPNIILLDLAMPSMSGWDIHRELRARPELNHIPIIAITALVMQEDAMRVEEAGFDGYITKPYRVEALLKKLTECIRAFLERQSRTD